MASIMIKRVEDKVDGPTIIKLRDLVVDAVAEALHMPSSHVEIDVSSYSAFAKNNPIVGIYIDTGEGKDSRRSDSRFDIAKIVAARIREANILPEAWFELPEPQDPNVWLRLFKSAFVPIGHPESAR